MATFWKGSRVGRRLSPAKRIELARALWGWLPHPTQRAWLLDEHKVKVAACGRRWGKTEASAIDVATYAIANNGSVQIIVAPTYDQSRLISNAVERLLLSNSEIRAHVQVTKTPYPDIRYRKSRIMARTADDDGRNLRGHSADRAIIDEAAFVRDEVIEEVIGPMLADRNGQLVMVSTPFGKNHFYRTFVLGQAEQEPWVGHQGPGGNIIHDVSYTPDPESPVSGRIRSFRFPSWANPHISREYIEYQKSVLTERQFKVEYEAEFVDDQNSVFPWDDIQAAISNGESACLNSPWRRVSHRGDEEALQSGIRIAGIDWARYSDYTAVVILEVWDARSVELRTPSPAFHVIALDRFNRMDWRAQVERIADLLCRFGVRGIAADQTSAGDPALELLRDSLWVDRRLDASIEGIVFTNQSKRELIDNLAIRLAHRDLTFPHIEQLVRELQFYEYELTGSGRVRTGARRGYNDDCVCALALALHAASRHRYSGGFSTSGQRRASAKGW